MYIALFPFSRMIPVTYYSLKQVHAQSLSRVWLFVTPWTVAHQAPLSMEFSRQESLCRALLQRIFSTLESNLGLLNCQQVLYCWAKGEAPKQQGYIMKFYMLLSPGNEIMWLNSDLPGFFMIILEHNHLLIYNHKSFPLRGLSHWDSLLKTQNATKEPASFKYSLKVLYMVLWNIILSNFTQEIIINLTTNKAISLI